MYVCAMCMYVCMLVRLLGMLGYVCRLRYDVYGMLRYAKKYAMYVCSESMFGWMYVCMCVCMYAVMYDDDDDACKYDNAVDADVCILCVYVMYVCAVRVYGMYVRMCCMYVA